ncbi:leucyl aminopeptidase [Candidatus Profftia lariciata]|uniref:leucyl aminopeptidase n=1 Tax=Candidatus Profftia lariciata TaxID=1987921 RepID=UPI001D012638|nr:leucyl aminopeptidase [Candidatus Profftia lariciata]
MEFSVTNIDSDIKKSDCIVIGIFESQQLPKIALKLDKISSRYINDFINRGELEGKLGQTLLLHYIPELPEKRILLIGCGKEKDFKERQYKEIIKKTINILKYRCYIQATYFLTELNVKNRNIYWKVRLAIETIKDTLYTFEQLKSKKIKQHCSLDHIVFSVPNNELIIAKCAIKHGLAIASGIQVAKDLGNLPPNLCNAGYLALRARQLADNFSHNISTVFIDAQQMKDLGMNAYLAVGQGSQNESLMSIISYKGTNESTKIKPIVLIGKGITFDSGGISIKHADNMDEMKYDMCGAASVYGIMLIVAKLQLPLNIIGILTGCENMPDGNSYRPGDVLTTMSGQTVEVLNTDAEGRLVLCDTLTYVKRFEPEIVIDVATLTGACVIALGHHFTGLMANNNTLATELIRASKQADDPAWWLPMTNEFEDQLNSNCADIANVSGRYGGAITAACFLSKFTKQYQWAHLDIAGTAWRTEKDKGATGRPISMLSQFLLNRAGLYKEN